ncbi:MAG: hypothetical protein K6C35_02315 [Eubacterium sp.]|nr:hypothetical protein [Eubacterium sp.]
MTNYTVNGEINVQYEEGFHVMSKEKIDHFFSEGTNREGFYDENRHLLIVIS